MTANDSRTVADVLGCKPEWLSEAGIDPGTPYHLFITRYHMGERAEQACDEVGVPYDINGLIRHHRGNAALVAAVDAYDAATRDVP